MMIVKKNNNNQKKNKNLIQKYIYNKYKKMLVQNPQLNYNQINKFRNKLIEKI